MRLRLQVSDLRFRGVQGVNVYVFHVLGLKFRSLALQPKSRTLNLDCVAGLALDFC